MKIILGRIHFCIMKRSIRFTKYEYDNILKLSGYLKIGSFSPQKFDDTEVINTIINYAWKKKKFDLDIIFQNRYESIESISKALSMFDNLFNKIGVFDYIKDKEKNQNKTLILSDESEKIINELMEKYNGKSITEIIKVILLGISMNPDYIMDIIIRFLLMQSFLFISIDRISEKYDYTKAKNDFINMNIPKIDIKKQEIDNYNYAFQKIKEIKSFNDLLSTAKNFGINENNLNELISYGLPSMLGIYENDTIPKSVKPMDLAAAKFFSKSLPAMIAIKLVTINALYTALKETKIAIPGVYATTYDKIMAVLLIENKMDSLIGNYGSIYKSVFNNTREWEDYINSFKNAT